MVKGFITELDPNETQKCNLLKVTAVQRKAYNYGLNKAKDYKKLNGRYPYISEIRGYNKDFTLLKKEDLNFLWFNEFSKCAHQSAILNLVNGFQRYYENLAEEPKFKSCYKSKRKFNFDNCGFKIKGKHIKIPTIGYIKLKNFKDFPVGDKIKYLNFTVSNLGNKWFISGNIEESIDGTFSKFNKNKVKVKKHDKVKTKDKDSENLDKINNSNLPIIGYDKGIKDYIVLSNGKKFNFSNKNKDRLHTIERRIKRLQRKHSHQTKGRKNPKFKVGVKRCNDFIENNINANGTKKRSNNSCRTKRCISVLYKKAHDLKLDAIHKITTNITKRTPLMLISESLTITNMVKNHRLAKTIYEQCWGEADRQIEYKSRLVGGHLFKIDTFYPSSKLCSGCGNKKVDLKLSDRTYYCEECGLVINRDLNAAINIRDYYLKTQKVSVVDRDPGESLKACGVGCCKVSL
jgi:putative transposase